MSETVQMLERLMSDQDETMKKVEKIGQKNRGETMLDFQKKLSELGKRAKDASGMTEQQARDLAFKVIEANFKELREAADQEEQDLAKAMYGLTAMVEGFGSEYAELTKPRPEEQAIVDSAEMGVRSAETRLKFAEQELKDAEHKWFEFRRQRARQKAKENIAKARQAIESAKQGVQEAKKQVASMVRDRLMKATFDMSFQQFRLMSDKIKQIMTERLSTINQQLKTVTAQKQEQQQAKIAATKEMEKQAAKLQEKEAELRREEDRFRSLQPGTDEHSIQDQKVSELRAEYEEIRGKHNLAISAYQATSNHAEQLEIHEATWIKMRDNQKMWILVLEIDTANRIKTFESRLEAMKVASDQEISSTIDKLGAEIDQRTAEAMAAMGAASDRVRVERLEAIPARIQEIARVAGLQIQAAMGIREREKEIIAEIIRNYGIDPLHRSYFTGEGGQAS